MEVLQIQFLDRVVDLEATVATRTRGVSMSTQITVATTVVSNEKVCEIIDDCEP